MTRPDWSKAPKWAQWAAMDSSGAWFWYEKEPAVMTHGKGHGAFTAGGNQCEPLVFAGWGDSLESRPAAAVAVLGPPAVALPSRLRLTEKTRRAVVQGPSIDDNAVYGQLRAVGWTDALLIEHGYAEEVK
jgi:hypothetical protein